ncbi:asparagine--tRNA ligase [Candidatus Roizmanbacteria bacterium RIFCSPHIGHO2_01_FULL_39_8]|uniref:Asparagine--tRNA ligase n=3 Tax=Candidatus Roizmaniibacteriota TaxID=1752723 RepID=A0A1F7GGG1_9BACT|nr:MAG: asparagine--tRNA ligase [Candidatus Roizmanbacteria bacterium RIFCSPHIGHO2_01_FULL_39_8]OGK28223.1 MAG: asparagine--tRNA ligase [Candidatus Roizmanbacteria bacterium RIFCSPHIGHO2_02_FULL_39_9]OGK35763.1 MAG: asparagine--tRNA ligase [Candidatus Roizmanbacteria bacterium RIFCSPHIGHO2_12_FULL_39_8]
MKPSVLIKEINEFIGKEVIIKGWVYNKRSSGKIHFLQIRDGSGFIQAIILKGEVSSESFAAAEKVTLESSVEMAGIVREDKRAPDGYELTAKELTIIQLAEEFPIGKKEHGPDFLLNNRHLWLRSKRQWAILRVRNEIIRSLNEYLQKEGFVRVDTPIITPSACEGTTTLFEIDYFGEKAYLSQSGQLYLEAAIGSLGRVYDFGPALRAEKSKTRRHLIEFWMMDAEAAFVDFIGILKVQEEMVYHIIQSVLKNCQKELEILERDTQVLSSIKLPFVRLTYKETIKLLNSLGSDIKIGSDFGNDDETILMNHYKKPVFVTHYPAEVKAFYAKKDPNDGDFALVADLLAPEGYGEVIGGGERESDYDTLIREIQKRNLNVKDYDWYLDLRKYGSVPHSGFGIGLERMVAWICKSPHVRETIPFPRLLGRFRP